MKSVFPNEANNYNALIRSLRILRITLLFLLVGVLQVNASTTYSQKSKISLNLSEKTIAEVLDEIEEMSDFFFVLDDHSVDLNRKLDIVTEESSIEQVLDAIFKGTDVKYRVSDRKILLSSESLLQEGRTVTGKVTDANGDPVIGATVVVRGTTIGTITDAGGNYTLQNVSANDILVFSFVGMETSEIAVTDQTTIDLTMQETSIGLDEVVVIGYGSIQKRDLTGAVASVGNEELASVGSISPAKALQANVAGVNVSQRTGTVGSDFDIQIRGVNTLTGAAPLYVVDGVMTDNINFLNVNDIVRIDVLKDASSTAIYGSRGSNGVIIVTTRTGEGMASQNAGVSYSGFVGVRTIANMEQGPPGDP
jgi:TonB-dependent SusC/RagA subfamily outer membrane receptor